MATVEKVEWAAWDNSNRHCLDTMKYTIDRTIRDSITSCDKAKDYLTAVGRFKYKYKLIVNKFKFIIILNIKS